MVGRHVRTVSEPEFVVQSVGDRPVVLGAHPTSVRQGAQAKIFIDMSAPADMTRPPPMWIDLGEGIIVETVERRGSGLDVQVSVAHDAPLGDHPIEIDEGDACWRVQRWKVATPQRYPNETVRMQPKAFCPLVGTHWPISGHCLAQAFAAERTEKSLLICACVMGRSNYTHTSSSSPTTKESSMSLSVKPRLLHPLGHHQRSHHLE